MKMLVVGFGSIGRRHAKNFSEHAEVAVYDANSKLLQGDQYQQFDRLDAALAWKPKGIVISTPHHSHIEIASKAIDSGVHVLVEKPISHSLNGVERLIAQAALRQKKLHVVCNMRFHSAVTALKQNLFRIGKPLFARAHYGNYLPNMRPNVDYRSLYAANREQGGGVILDAIHELDYLQWFFGAVRSVSAESGKLSHLDIDVEDYAAICLHHDCGVRTEIHLDYLQHCKRRGCEIVGDEGTLIWKSIGKAPEECEVRYYSAKDRQWETLYQSDDEDVNFPYQQMAGYFFHSISDQNTELATGEEGLASLQIALAAQSSADSGRRVILNS